MNRIEMKINWAFGILYKLVSLQYCRSKTFLNKHKNLNFIEDLRFIKYLVKSKGERMKIRNHNCYDPIVFVTQHGVLRNPGRNLLDIK